MNLSLVIEILIFALIPFGTMILGGFFGTYLSVKDKFRSLLLHLAAGVIFAVVTTELMPAIITKQSLSSTTIGFFAGLAVMMLIKFFSDKSQQKHKELVKNAESEKVETKKLPWSILVGVAVDITIDGILLGIGFATGKTEGLLLTIALALEILVLGMVISTELKTEKFKKKTTILIIILTALNFVIGAFIGSIILNYASPLTLNGILAFGLAALIYLVTEELLVEAHETKDSAINTAVFFVGFFVFMIIAILN
jgi:ZIP family zinc transporter